MQQPHPSCSAPSAVGSTRPVLRSPRPAQRGVVLVIALLLLVVISLVTAMNVRNATSSEAVAGNVRTTQLAMQAAEIALRYCEDSVSSIVSGTGTFTTTMALSNIQAYSATPRWTSTTLWDSSPSVAFVLPTNSVNGSGVSATYARMPECMVENMPKADASGASTATKTYVITARGFGPEVDAANATRDRPKGSEVWLQSTIELN
jgi:type IV pilus assembly protein PilX